MYENIFNRNDYDEQTLLKDKIDELKKTLKIHSYENQYESMNSQYRLLFSVIGKKEKDFIDAFGKDSLLMNYYFDSKNITF